MPSGPIGNCWESGSWEDTAWEANSWADDSPPPSGGGEGAEQTIIGGTHPRTDDNTPIGG